MSKPQRAIPLERLTVMSQAEVAKAMGVTPMRICQIERKALAKIGREFIARKIVNSSGQYSNEAT